MSYEVGRYGENREARLVVDDEARRDFLSETRGLRSGLKTYSCPFRIPVVPAVNRSVYACSRVLLVQAELRVAAEAARHQNARQIVLRLAGHRTSDAMGC